MSKPSEAAVIAMSALAAASFWLGSQPLFMCYLGYHKFWLGEGQGYEGGMSGFVGGMFLWNLFLCVPSAVMWFGAVVLRLMLTRKKTSVNFVQLFVFSGVFGIAWPLFILVLVLYGSM